MEWFIYLCIVYDIGGGSDDLVILLTFICWLSGGSTFCISGMKIGSSLSMILIVVYLLGYLLHVFFFEHLRIMYLN